MRDVFFSKKTPLDYRIISGPLPKASQLPKPTMFPPSYEHWLRMGAKTDQKANPAL